MQLAGIGRVLFWEGGSLWIALVVAGTDFHSHHAVQICLPLDGEAQFRTNSDEAWIRYSAAIVAPDVAHSFQAPGRVVAHIFFEPESEAGRKALSRYGSAGIAALPKPNFDAAASRLAQAYFAQANDDELISLARDTIATASGAKPQGKPVDPRVTDAIAAIHRRLEEPILLSDVAKSVDLSAGRFRHLFVSETGISFRAFVLWARLNRALAIGFGGGSWTEAAHAANFSDSAHLTRTCRRMFGIAPTAARIEAPQSAGRRSA